MAESTISLTEGSGAKKSHTWSRTVSATTVEDGFTLPGEYPYATYVVVAQNVSLATSASHVLQIMAGSTLNLRIRRVTIEQANNATAAGSIRISTKRLTTAGTGGTVITPAKMDPADAAAGATAMTLPTVKGTEGDLLGSAYLTLRQAVSATSSPADDPAYVWTQLLNQKPIVIAAGTSNGIALVVGTGVAGATADIVVELVETAY